MTVIQYLELKDVDPHALLTILNKISTREHLVPHEPFTSASIKDWIAEKANADSTEGCVVRGIEVDGALAGWCGIQIENGSHELAIVVDEAYWGIGKHVFKDTLSLEQKMGHSVISMHLYNTRPKYRFLESIASRVYQSTIFGKQYTTYEIKLD